MCGFRLFTMRTIVIAASLGLFGCVRVGKESRKQKNVRVRLLLIDVLSDLQMKSIVWFNLVGICCSRYEALERRDSLQKVAAKHHE